MKIKHCCVAKIELSCFDLKAPLIQPFLLKLNGAWTIGFRSATIFCGHIYHKMEVDQQNLKFMELKIPMT
jgi:hypothetical protein